MKKTYFAVIAGGLAIAMVLMGGSRLRAQAGSTGSSGISLSSLAGSFSGEGASHFGVCFNENLMAVQSCSKTPQAQIVPFVVNAKSRATIDTKGHSCAEVVDISAPVFPGPQPTVSQAGRQVHNYIAVGVTTSYNPATSSGDVSYKFYAAGPGVTCQGATFVNTAKVPVSFTETAYFMVSENGNRFDLFVLTVHTNSSVDFTTGNVGRAFALRQTY